MGNALIVRKGGNTELKAEQITSYPTTRDYLAIVATRSSACKRSSGNLPSISISDTALASASTGAWGYNSGIGKDMDFNLNTIVYGPLPKGSTISFGGTSNGLGVATVIGIYGGVISTLKKLFSMLQSEVCYE